MEKKKNYEIDEQGNYLISISKKTILVPTLILLLYTIGLPLIPKAYDYNIIESIEIISNDWGLIFISVILLFSFCLQGYFIYTGIVDLKHKRPSIFIGKDRLYDLNSIKRNYGCIEYHEIKEMKKETREGSKGRKYDVVCITFHDGTNTGNTKYKERVGEYKELPCYNVVRRKNTYDINPNGSIKADELLELLTEKVDAWRGNKPSTQKEISALIRMLIDSKQQ